MLADDPGSKLGDDKATAAKAKKVLREAVATIGDVPATIDDVAEGVTAVFSPRRGLGVLDLYVTLIDSAEKCSAVTLAFGINKAFKEQLKDNPVDGPLVFLLLEKKDKPNPRSRDTFVTINAANNVYKAWGSYLDDPVYQWVRETNARILKLSKHVSYIHSKFLLRDPLSMDPIVVTGSANFSNASINANDENMLLIRGDRRVADIYFTEFNRLFNHYYFRAVTEVDGQHIAHAVRAFLTETPDEWLEKYAPGSLRQKRLQIYTKMDGFTEEV